MKTLDVLKTSKYVWEELKRLGFRLTVKDSVKLARKNNELCKLAQEPIDLIYSIRKKLIHIGETYIIKCPKCGSEHSVKMIDLKLWEKVSCDSCKQEYYESDCIEYIVCKASDLREMTLACSDFLKKAEEVCEI